MQILQVTTYSLDNPRHGGQIRCSEIRKKLEKMGNKVDSLCIIQSHEKSKKNPHIKATEQTWRVSQHLREILTDVDLHFTFQTEKWQAEIQKQVDINRFDLVIIEQPWMYKPITMAFRLARRTPSFVYSSQNVEAPLKAAILGYLGKFTTEEIEQVKSVVEKIENDAALSSQLTVAVSPNDSEYFDQLGAKNVIASNGTNFQNEQNFDFHSTSEKYFLFVGSGHPPNFEGFNKFLGDSLAYLPPDFKIYCVGSVCHLIREWAEAGGAAGTFSSRSRLIGEVTEEQLAALINSAQAILLPINTGGGSNLKTAEALASGKTVISTPVAMRGFENWIGQPGVYVDGTPAEFRKQVYRIAAQGDNSAQFPRQSSKQKPLSWSDALSSLEVLNDKRFI